MATWLECPNCGGVFVVQQSDDSLSGQLSTPAKQLMHRDGTPVASDTLSRCDDCGATLNFDWIRRNYTKQRRTADALPPPPATADTVA